jgi:hypothetical protein
VPDQMSRAFQSSCRNRQKLSTRSGASRWFANPALWRAGLGHLAGGDTPRGSPRNGCRSADSTDGGGRAGFALFCVATYCLTLLPMARSISRPTPRNTIACAKHDPRVPSRRIPSRRLAPRQ